MLRQRFLDCFATESPDVVAAWEEIHAAYTARGRHYHNLDHLSAIFAGLDAFPGPVEDARSLTLATFYHDLIYHPLRKDNEARSADLATTRLLQTGIAAREVQKIHRWILATADHDPGPDPETDLLLFLDLDLGILGASPERYRSYLREIRKEYRLVPGPLYRRGRRKVVRHFLAMPRLYRTAYFHERLEERAKNNLRSEVGI